ncbi:heme-containing dehydratase protein [Aspergillus cavernicola]|uniref:Heme-containing dehydratase protein n=1 Tax=Aspergillus cavernicola TaxID=176166 RepID=A0ABR4IEY9_9EURO
MTSTTKSNRIYPLTKPPNHKPPMERWKLEFPETNPPRIYTTYIGVQRHNSSSTPNTLPLFIKALTSIQTWLDNLPPTHRPVFEKFTLLEGDDAPEARIWVCYWSDSTVYDASIQELNLINIYTNLDKPRNICLWTEHFTSRTSSLETNYSGLDYLPGLARLPGSTPIEHTLTAYWGAARDRIPDSGFDLFPQASENVTKYPLPTPNGLAERIYGENSYDNIVHIRSGQFWGNCDTIESEAYEAMLEPTLNAGLRYLWENRADSGALGLRFLRNDYTTTDPDLDREEEGKPKETCATGFFRNLSDLEKWSKRHPSHLAIFNGAIGHAKRFGEERKFRTWHEVSVLKKGDAKFEYVNCMAKTGVIRFLGLEKEGV